MSIVRKLEVVLAAILLALVVLLGAKATFTTWRADKAQENYQAAAGDARAAGAYVTAHKAVEKQRSAKNAEVERVLDESREWADAPVPDDVADLLRHSSGTTRSVPE